MRFTDLPAGQSDGGIFSLTFLSPDPSSLYQIDQKQANKNKTKAPFHQGMGFFFFSKEELTTFYLWGCVFVCSGPLFSPHGTGGLNLGNQAWQQLHSSTRPSFWVCLLFFFKEISFWWFSSLLKSECVTQPFCVFCDFFFLISFD